MGEIRGLLIQSRLDYLENLKDKPFSRVMQKLPESARQAVGEQVFTTNLYPFQLLQELDSAIAGSTEIPQEQVFREMGRNYASTIMNRYFFNYMEAANPQKFLAQLGNLYNYLWNFGSLKYQKQDPNSANVEFTYDQEVHKGYCWFMQQLLTEGLKMCGAKQVEIQETVCSSDDGDTCRYQIKWQ
ncbi:MAG: TIGR02265 family protein [Calditrichia bacterium]